MSRSWAPREQHRAADGEQQRGRELGHRQAARLQVVGREEDGQQRDGHEQQVQEDGQLVAHVGAAEDRLALGRQLAVQPGERPAATVTTIAASRPTTRGADDDGRSRRGQIMSTMTTSMARPTTRRNGAMASHSFWRHRQRTPCAAAAARALAEDAGRRAPG